jgi:hypothetical protein
VNRKLLGAAGLTGASIAVTLSLAPAPAQAAGAPCMVRENIMGKSVIQWYEDGDVIETEMGNIVCVNGVWEGPNVDSPMPGGGGPGPILA